MNFLALSNKAGFSIIYQNILAFTISAYLARSIGPYNYGIWARFILLFGYLECFCKHQFDITSIYYLGKKNLALINVIQ